MRFCGSVPATPTRRKGDFVKHAEPADGEFTERDANRVRKCRGDHVPDGKCTGFRRAAQATICETVVHSRVERPKKATRVASRKRIMEPERLRDRMIPVLLDALRIVFGGFEPVVSLRRPAKPAAFDDVRLTIEDSVRWSSHGTMARNTRWSLPTVGNGYRRVNR